MTKIHSGLLGAAVAATLIASSTAGLAQGTAEQRSACTGDAFRFCSSEIPNVGRITTCMKVNYSKLSPGCRAVMAKG